MTTVANKPFKQAKSIKDDKFSIDKIERYCLIIQIGNRDLQVCIIDTTSDRVLFLEDYILDAVATDEEKVQQLQDLFESHHLLMVGFWKEVMVCFKSDKFALVPLSLFSKEHARALLKMNCKVQESDSVGYYKVNGNESVNIFTYNKPVLNWLRTVYKNSKLKVTQQTGALINNVVKHASQDSGILVSLYIDRFYLHATVSKNEKILFFNSFFVSKFDDYLKYIALVLNEFKLDKKDANIKLWGHIKQNSSHFNAITDKIPAIKIGERTNHLNFGYKFDEIPEHQFSDVYGNYFNL